jgi:hypothetical protein
MGLNKTGPSSLNVKIGSRAIKIESYVNSVRTESLALRYSKAVMLSVHIRNPHIPASGVRVLAVDRYGVRSAR